MAALTQPNWPPATLVGRSRELDLLARCLHRARSGHGSMVVVSGEAGVGKTILVNQLNHVALTLVGNCYEFSATPPYGPWFEILDDLHQRNLSGATDGQRGFQGSRDTAQDRHDVFIRILDEITGAAARQPLVLVLEDLHWSDNASVEMLQSVARHLHHHPIMLVVTYRDDDLDRDSPFYRLLPHLMRDRGAERIHLKRLNQADTNEIVNGRYDLTEQQALQLGEYLQARAQGNPFFTMEILYALEDQETLRLVNGKWQLTAIDGPDVPQPMPELVRQVIEGRLDQLSDLSRHLLSVASVIGQDVPVSLWRKLSDIDEHAFGAGVERTLSARFVEESAEGRTVSFRHALVREVVYLGIPLPERQQLHRRAADVLIDAANPDADGIAYHLARGLDDRAVTWLVSAAGHALSISAPYAALQHCDLAIELAGTLGVALPVETYATRGNAHSMVGAFQSALSDLTRHLQETLEHGDKRSEWQALQNLGQLWAARDYGKTREYFDEALELARSLRDEQLVAHSLNRVGNWYLNDDQPGEAIRFHDEALKIFRSESNQSAVMQTLDLLGMDLLILGDLKASVTTLREAIDGFGALGDRVGFCSALGTFITAAGATGFEHEIPGKVTNEELQESLDQALALSREIHWRSGEAFILCTMGGHYLVRGRYGQALHTCRLAVSIAEEIVHREWHAYALSGVSDTHLSLLDTEPARTFAERALEMAAIGGSQIHEKAARVSLASALIASGDSLAALEVLDACGKPSDPPRSASDRNCRVAQARAILKSGNPQAALDLVDRLIQAALPAGHNRVAPILGLTRAEALIEMGDYREAQASLVAARDYAMELGYDPVLWRTFVALGNLHTALNRPGDAERAFANARTIIESLADNVSDEGLRAHFRERALDMLPAGSGLSAFQSARQQSGGLTPRQRDVAILVARGQTNAAIGDALSISERTVEGHVSAIMTTLNFTSRTQIAAWAVDQQLVTL